MAILIKNAKIITMNDNMDIIEKGYIYIVGQKIEKIGTGEFSGINKDARVIDGRGYTIMPGLVNCHTHAAMTLLRGYGEGLPLMRWLNEKIWPMESKFNKRHIELGTKLACVEMIKSGTTSFNDMYYFQDVVLRASLEANVRTVLGIPLIGEAWEKQLFDAGELIKKIGIDDKSGLITSMFAPHSPYTLTKEALIEVAGAAKEKDSGIHIHIAETKDEVEILNGRYKMTPVEFLLETGIFESRVVGAHCVHLTIEDMKILKNNNVNPVYNPQSNMKLASGVAPVVDMLETGINVCMGTDGASSNNNLNLFEEMETGALLQKLWYKDPTVLDSMAVLRMCTVNGAKALGFNNLGSLKEGFLADLIMLNMNRPNLVPEHDIYSNLVFAANGSEVDYVIINGEIVMDKGALTKIDEEKLLFECKELCDGIV